MKAISVKPTTVRPTRGLQVRSFSANKRSTQILRSNVKPSNLFAKNFTTSTILLQNRFGSAFGSQVSPSGNSGFSKTEQSAVAPRVFRPEEVDLSKLQFSELKTNQNKGKYVQVLYDGRPLRIQTPAMRAPFGVAKNQFNDEDISFALALALDHPEANKDVADLQTLLEGVDEAVKNACKANHTSWLPSVPKEKVAATLEINYKSSIRQPTENPTQPEKKYAPTWRVKIPTNRETREVTAPIFGGSKDAPTRITVNDIMKGNRVMVIAELRSVYFVANMLGISWAARQVFVTEKSPNFSDFAFNLKSDSTSKEAEATQGNSKVGQKPLIFKPASSL